MPADSLSLSHTRAFSHGKSDFYINVKNNMMRWREWRYKKTDSNVCIHTRVIWNDMSKITIHYGWEREWKNQRESGKKLSKPFSSSSKYVSEYEWLKREDMPCAVPTHAQQSLLLSYHLVNAFLITSRGIDSPPSTIQAKIVLLFSMNANI